MQPECPEPELLAVYIEHVCRERERQEIEAHLVDCQDCRQIVALIIKSKTAVPDIKASDKSANSSR